MTVFEKAKQAVNDFFMRPEEILYGIDFLYNAGIITEKEYEELLKMYHTYMDS